MEKQEIQILIVEDELSILNIEKAYLEKEGYQVLTAENGQEALDRFDGDQVDLVILDLMLPQVPGERVLEAIREDSDCPVIIVSAKSEERDRVDNLRRGADDFLVKPFSARELVERVKAILRRVPPKEQGKEILSSDGRILLHPDSMRAFKDQKEIHLTRNEFMILATLFTHPDKIFTRDEIIEITFGMDYEAYDRAIDTHIKNIRQKIEEDPKHPLYIQTVYGVGYRANSLAV